MWRKWIILFALFGWMLFSTHTLIVTEHRSRKNQLDVWADENEGNMNVRSRSSPDHYLSENKILNMLMKNYDKRIRPPPNNSTLKGTLDPVLVKVNILIRMLSKIDVVNMEYSMQITFRERWQDRRLAFDYLNLAHQPKFLTVPHIKSSIWLPDTFFPTEKTAHRHMIDTENMFLRIYGNGTILYSARLSLTCSCPMHLQLYPLDVQHCDFDLISYAHTTRDILYEWDTEPVQLKPGVGEDLPNFLLEKENIDTRVECSSHTNTGESLEHLFRYWTGTYACLRMRMRLSRLMTYFVLQLYFPTTMIVIVSWVSFWIDMHSTAGRVALAMTTLLTITTMQSSINAKLPPVNYVKVIDVWLGTCQTFVFGALIEYAIVCYRDNKIRSEKNRQSAAVLRKSQSTRARYKNPTAAALTPTTRQLMTDGNLQKISSDESDYYVDKSAPCTCSLGGIGSAMLAGFGFLEPALTTLIPMSIEYPSPDEENDTINAGNRMHHNHCGDTFLANDFTLEPSCPYSCGGRRHFSLRFRMPFLSQNFIWRTIKRKLKKPDYLPARIDYYARILMPVGFLIFNAFYWGICLYMSSKQQIK